ncbi:hypothetical protein LJR074_002597 [Acidovorax sp. LjRoot74]|uniref:hypothetical protein n=1 Tax=Acidovorax sp. LjRoot74 TaxID=3342337 RepID=UPI003ECDABB0
MSISLVVSPKVKFPVKGSIKDESGVDKPFDFTLTCKRLDTDEIQAKKNEDGSYIYADFMAGVIEDWSGVKDKDNQAVLYTTDAWQALSKIPGVAALAWQAYMRENGAKEKN